MIFNEFKHRKKHTITTISGFAIGFTLLILVISLSSSFKELAGKPLEKIGCNITVQLSGNVPEDMDGAVFPCAAITIPQKTIDIIQSGNSSIKMSKAILLWVFDDEIFHSVLGIEFDNPLGPSLLKTQITDGLFLNNDKPEVVVEKTFAEMNNIEIGQSIKLTDKIFEVIGIVNSSSLGKIVSANLYIPFSQASKMAVESQAIQQIAPFEIGDASILFLDVKQNQIQSIDKKIKNLLGEKVTVSSPISFLMNFKGILNFFNAFSNIISLIIIIITILLTSLTIISSLNKRKHEFGVFKAVGWRPSELSRYIISETFVLSFVGAVSGIFLSYLIIILMKMISVEIPIPWELNSATPHFLMDNPDEKMLMKIKLPVYLSWLLVSYTLAGAGIAGIIIGYFSGRKVNKIKPSEAIKNAQ